MKKQNNSGFTIIELLVVIVVIGILAAITIVSYVGVQQRAMIATIKSDLKGASTQLGLDYAISNDTYPTQMADANSGKGLSKSNTTTYQYSKTSYGYCLSATSSYSTSIVYHISSNAGAIEEGLCAEHDFPISWSGAGYGHTCSLTSSNLAYCWGSASTGQLGNNSNVQSRVPVPVSTSGALSGKTIKSLVVGGYHACVIASDEKIYCWGNNTYGQLGDNKVSGNWSLVPVSIGTSGVLSGKTIKHISAGYQHTCAITSDGIVYCWGDNTYGQLGDNKVSGNQSNNPVAINTAVALNGKTVKYVSAGYYHTCAIASDDKAYCWGFNDYGGLGDNSTSQRLTPVSVFSAGVLSGKTIRSMATGIYHSCALDSDGVAYCWGYGGEGRLGNNSTSQSQIPVIVSMTNLPVGSKSFKSIALGNYHSCGISSNDKVYCWGRNISGQLGIGSTDGSNHPVPVATDTAGVLSGKTIKSLSTGNYHTCAIDTDNKSYCWGFNDGGQYGNDTVTQNNIPMATFSFP